MEPIRLAIVGWRGFEDYERLTREVDQWRIELGNPPIEYIISGGAEGTDSLAEKYAKRHDILMIVLVPDWKGLGKRAGLERNTDIIKGSTHVIAFLSPNSRGTFDSINKARRMEKVLKVIDI